MHTPSFATKALLRKGAEQILSTAPYWAPEIDKATLPSVSGISEETIAMIRLANRRNILHWATETARAPGEPVPPNLSPDMLQIAREQARLGLDEMASDAYRAGQKTAWLMWMRIAFSLSKDPSELQDLLDYSARSIAEYVESTVFGLRSAVETELADLARGSEAERRKLVQDFLAGLTTLPTAVSRKLGYRLEQTHWAAVLWTDEAQPDSSRLEDLANSIIRTLGHPSALSIPANPATHWLWLPEEINANTVAALVPDPLHVAIGPRGTGPNGFRHSHQKARIVARIQAAAPSHRRVVTYDEVRMVSTMTSDRAVTDAFVSDCLGDLSTARPALRDVLLCYIRQGCSVVDTAAALNLHRNTVLRNIARAEDLLPRKLDAQTRLDVGVALEFQNWILALTAR